MKERLNLSERLKFTRGVLEILKDTRLFGPLVDQAIEDLEDLMGETIGESN